MIVVAPSPEASAAAIQAAVKALVQSDYFIKIDPDAL